MPTLTGNEPLREALRKAIDAHNEDQHAKPYDPDCWCIAAAAALAASSSQSPLDAARLLAQFVREGRIEHRGNPRCRELMPTDGRCDCGLREARALAAAYRAEHAESLFVSNLTLAA